MMSDLMTQDKERLRKPRTVAFICDTHLDKVVPTDTASSILVQDNRWYFVEERQLLPFV